MKEYKSTEFPQLILKLVDLFSEANHKMNMMKVCETKEQEEFYSRAYNNLAQELKELDVIMMDSDEVEILGTKKRTFTWSRKNPTVIKEIQDNASDRRYRMQSFYTTDLPIKQFKPSELPELCDTLRTLLKPFLNQFKLLENLPGNNSDDIHSKLYNDLYYQIKEMGLIMIADDQVQIRTTDGKYYLWHYDYPTMLYTLKWNSTHFVESQIPDTHKFYLEDFKNK